MAPLARTCSLLAAGFVALSEAATPEPYDCDLAYDSWEAAWSPGWKAWCCLYHEKGCVATWTATATSTTVTDTSTSTLTATGTSTTGTVTTVTSTSVTSTTGTTTTIDAVAACQSTCNQGGVTGASCKDRLQWVSQFVTQNEGNACEAAAANVLKDCPSECRGCTAEGAYCTSAQAPPAADSTPPPQLRTDQGWRQFEAPIFVKKFEVQMAAHHAATATKDVAAPDPFLKATAFFGAGTALLGIALLAARKARRPAAAAGVPEEALIVEDEGFDA